jgi:hypothetical protein
MRSSYRSAILAAALALLPGALLAGCSAELNVGSGDSEASGEEIASEIRGAYADKTGIAMRRLTCESVKAEAGAGFECSGHNARGVELGIVGRVTETGGDGFDYHWHVARAIAPGVLYERALRREVEARGVGLSEVRCPVEIEVKVGRVLRCKATDRDGVTRGVSVKLTDLDGGFEFTVEGEDEKGSPPA